MNETLTKVLFIIVVAVCIIIKNFGGSHSSGYSCGYSSYNEDKHREKYEQKEHERQVRMAAEEYEKALHSLHSIEASNNASGTQIGAQKRVDHAYAKLIEKVSEK